MSWPVICSLTFENESAGGANVIWRESYRDRRASFGEFLLLLFSSWGRAWGGGGTGALLGEDKRRRVGNNCPQLQTGHCTRNKGRHAGRAWNKSDAKKRRVRNQRSPIQTLELGKQPCIQTQGRRHRYKSCRRRLRRRCC